MDAYVTWAFPAKWTLCWYCHGDGSFVFGSCHLCEETGKLLIPDENAIEHSWCHTTQELWSNYKEDCEDNDGNEDYSNWDFEELEEVNLEVEPY